MARKRGAAYLQLEGRLRLAELDFRERGLVAKSELNRVKCDADRLGYGIFGIKVKAFLHEIPPQTFRPALTA
jgi:hypothetical protein